MTRKTPLSAREVQKGLAAAGFEKRPQKATGHEQWVRTDLDSKGKATFRKVTLSPHNEPFRGEILKSIASQAGLKNVNQLYELCSKEGQKKAKRGLLRFLLPSVDQD
ncbi:type II toxin-antitoxin system HicA family toxin [Sessilibacter corallicola]|uniref:type II toxin-antitoxin system HicA family toxin n=1 Tax=Sessilibacter corallicola TaxID=2904075 RepID=UPI001E3FCEA0|nr:type II toxin-antitoxin system HicA family toxin [Sessilibacter corallicola]MCE2029251.1 type II toxin-antitoxin system HicA family toxin [Sessilibacter corallicola]